MGRFRGKLGFGGAEGVGVPGHGVWGDACVFGGCEGVQEQGQHCVRWWKPLRQST